MLTRAAFVGGVLAALQALACGGGSTSPSSGPGNNPPPSGSGSSNLTISMVRGGSTLTTTAYAPNPLTVPVGSTVIWTNNDITTHDATADNKSFATGLVAPGASASVTLQIPGRITYYCTLHPGMTGAIDVQ